MFKIRNCFESLRPRHSEVGHAEWVFIDPKKLADQRSMRYGLSPAPLPPFAAALLTEVGIALPTLASHLGSTIL